MDILSEYIGLDLKELKDISENNAETARDIAVSIVKLTEYPEWKVFEDELNRLLSNVNKECEFYATNPNQAWYDSGVKRAIQIIQRFVEKQHNIIKMYAESKN